MPFDGLQYDASFAIAPPGSVVLPAVSAVVLFARPPLDLFPDLVSNPFVRRSATVAQWYGRVGHFRLCVTAYVRVCVVYALVKFLHFSS